ncbi:MAG: helix-turn-helix transcriptional regulator [Acidimicrobiia bacterium]
MTSGPMGREEAMPSDSGTVNGRDGSNRTARAVLLGTPGLVRDAMVVALTASGVTATSLPSSSVRYATFDVLVLIEPRRRDWELLESVSPTGVVVVLDEATDPLEAVLSGADAVIRFGEPVAALVSSIEIVASGGAVLDQRLARALADTARSAIVDGASGPSHALTQRESSVLRSIERGDSTKQTARTLGVAVKTVGELQRRASRKLGARNCAHAVALLATTDVEETPASQSGALDLRSPRTPIS